MANKQITVDELQAFVDQYEDVSSSVFLFARDNSSAKIVVRHGNSTHTVLHCARSKKGKLQVDRSEVLLVGENPDMTPPPNAIKPEQNAVAQE